MMTHYRYAAALALGLLVGWIANGWRLDAELAEQGRAHESHLRQTAEANAAVIRAQQAEQQRLATSLAAADQQSTEELSHAVAENDRLRRLYSAADADRQRLRIEVRVARADAVVSAATSTGSLGDAAIVELSAAAGRAVWDLRRAMIEDRAKLEYLQEWARALQPR